MEIQEHKYFFWGSANPDQFGLYSPILDRFLAVDEKPDCLEYVAFLLSAKINLWIVPLSLAPNFQGNLIDNSCCNSWGVVDWSDYKQFQPEPFYRKQSYFLGNCGTLVNKPDSHDIAELQKLAWLAVDVVNFFKFDCNFMYTKFYDMVSMPFESNTMHYQSFKSLEKQCFDMIYLSENYNDTEKNIETILPPELRDNLKKIL